MKIINKKHAKEAKSVKRAHFIDGEILEIFIEMSDRYFSYLDSSFSSSDGNGISFYIYGEEGKELLNTLEIIIPQFCKFKYPEINIIRCKEELIVHIYEFPDGKRESIDIIEENLIC